MDGALKANNPIRLAEQERKLIWPNSGEFPDIHVSIGTGTTHRVDAAVGERRVGSLHRPATGVSLRVQIGKGAVKDIMDSETVWHDFCQPLTEEDRTRYRRLNVPFTEGNEIPAMHDISSLKLLQETAHDYCSKQEVLMQLRYIARQLVASTFYFDFKAWARPGQRWDCTGYLCNRMLQRHADAVENLILKRPVFRVYEDGIRNSIQKVIVGPEDNHQRGIWSLKMLFSVHDRRRRLDIKMQLQGAEEEYSISGFPRTLESS
jgi:hypothetical protein